MRNLKCIIYIIVLLIVSLQSFAQNRDRNTQRNGRESDREALTIKRNKYLTEKMALTAEEAAVFIPLDNELLRKKFEVRRECRRLERELQNKKEKTDDEYKKLLKCKEDEKEKMKQLDKDYLEKFQKVLSAEKLLKYQDADKAFGGEFMRDRR